MRTANTTLRQRGGDFTLVYGPARQCTTYAISLHKSDHRRTIVRRHAGHRADDGISQSGSQALSYTGAQQINAEQIRESFRSHAALAGHHHQPREIAQRDLPWERASSSPRSPCWKFSRCWWRGAKALCERVAALRQLAACGSPASLGTEVPYRASLCPGRCRRVESRLEPRAGFRADERRSNERAGRDA
jgi:hypothetical protein